MSSIVLSGDTSGSVTVSAPAVAGTQTVTLPVASGVLQVSGNMPAFSVYRGANQSVSSGAITKVQLNAETFDTANAFDSTTNYRFTPQVAGYYQVNGSMRFTGTALTECQVIIYKNGAGVSYGNYYVLSPQSTLLSIATTLVYLNGTTDYLELYGYVAGTSPVFTYVDPANTCVFTGSLVRGA